MSPAGTPVRVSASSRRVSGDSGIRSSRATASSLSPREISSSASTVDGRGVVALDLECCQERRLVAERDERVDLGLFSGRDQALNEFLDRLLWLCAHEPVDNFAVDHRINRRNRLHLECGGHRLIGVYINLGQLDRAVGLCHHTLDNRTELLARAAPRSPQVDHHRDGLGPLHDGSFECRVCYVSHDSVNVPGRQIIPSKRSRFDRGRRRVLQCNMSTTEQGRR